MPIPLCFSLKVIQYSIHVKTIYQTNRTQILMTALIFVSSKQVS